MMKPAKVVIVRRRRKSKSSKRLMGAVIMDKKKPYVPPDATWYIAEIVLAFTVVGETTSLVHVNFILVRAESPEEAYTRAMEFGNSASYNFVNTDGDTVFVNFAGLRNLLVIYEELTDGAELFYEKHTDMSEDAVRSLVRPKHMLAVFYDDSNESTRNHDKNS